MNDKHDLRMIRDRICGSLIGGAAGDALGYPVEFLMLSDILYQYGESGITEYAPDYGKAKISDDTQMTLFTANGLLCAMAHGDPENAENYVYRAYRDWLYTQKGTLDPPRVSWLLDVQELFALRAPGNTCMSALMSGKMGTPEQPLNRSKGCGGVMRVAPYGLIVRLSAEEAFAGACGAAAITHGHRLGWLPAGMLAYIVHRLVFDGAGLREAIADCVAYMLKRYPFDESRELAGLTESALKLTENDAPDTDNIRRLGEGWIGDEALAIALYAAVKYENDFDRALICAVNHNGDSDSTGAIAGNIVGAIAGYESIAATWETELELSGVILELADDLFLPCSGNSTGDPDIVDAWERKYLR